jgi:hypothetical protein
MDGDLCRVLGKGLAGARVTEAYVSVLRLWSTPGSSTYDGTSRVPIVPAAYRARMVSVRIRSGVGVATARRDSTRTSRKEWASTRAGCSMRTSAIASIRWFCTMSFSAPAPS